MCDASQQFTILGNNNNWRELKSAVWKLTISSSGRKKYSSVSFSIIYSQAVFTRDWQAVDKNVQLELEWWAPHE